LANSIHSELIIDIERAFDTNKYAFNVVAPVGGPMFIRKEASCHVKPFTCATFEVIHDCWIGYLHLWDDKCGIDNLKTLLGGTG
jgi:hypothetical protein